jgi:hypothetical protein
LETVDETLVRERPRRGGANILARRFGWNVA